jgi:hypothetical protein
MRQNFWEWFAEATANITVNLSQVEESLRKLIRDMEDYDYQQRNSAERFNVPQFMQQVQQGFADYPGLPTLIQALQSQEWSAIWQAYQALDKYINQLEKTGDRSTWLNNYHKLEPKRKLSRQVFDYLRCVEYLKGDKAEFDASSYEANVADLVEQSKKNMEVIRGEVDAAISRIANWNGSPIVITANPAEDERGPISEPATSAHIGVGGGQDSPEFLYFKDEGGKVEIDDVIEGDEEDCFPNPQSKADYFVLINELRNPGSTSKGKMLTLYTARPTRDRNMYLNTTTLPINIFLTNSYDHASGLARDLGSSEVRDIWRVRIDSRYLTQTLDGMVKYYQVTTPNAEARSIDLIDPGE